MGRPPRQDFHVVGSDASGVVLRVGSAVRNWKPGDRVVVHCNYVDDQDPSAHDDSMLAANQRIWGFESNFGGLADLSIVKANQLMPKPAHLTWEESAVNGLCASTSYRMLVGRHAARMKQGDNVFIWGATGGIGAYATQLVLNGGGTPVGVVSSDDRAQLLHAMGCEHVIDRKAEGYRFWSDEHTQDEGEWRRLGKKVRSLVGEDPDIVFEHPGRQTMGASVFIAKRGGTIVTCAATSGYMIEYDNRHLWMKLKRIVSSHFANYREAWEMNRLIDRGAIQPVMSAVYPLEQVGEAARDGPPQRGRGQARRAVPGARGRPGRHRPREAGPHRRGPHHPVPAPRRRRALTGPARRAAGLGLRRPRGRRSRPPRRRVPRGAASARRRRGRRCGPGARLLDQAGHHVAPGHRVESAPHEHHRQVGRPRARIATGRRGRRRSAT